MRALEILNEKLVGTAIYSFHVGDNWTLNFGDCFLSVQNLVSPDEGILNEWLCANYASFQTAVDKEFIAKSTVVTAHMRKEVTSVTLDAAYNLTIHFENDSIIVIPTNEDIVDWQWCLNETGQDPYMDYLVACFWEGEIAINKVNVSLQVEKPRYCAVPGLFTSYRLVAVRGRIAASPLHSRNARNDGR
jgi:hypothetical protein